MNQEEKIKKFKKMYAGKIMVLNKDLVPAMKSLVPRKDETTIIRFPECRTALAIMIQDHGKRYFPEIQWKKD